MGRNIKALFVILIVGFEFSIFIHSASSGQFSTKVSAETFCQPVYGGGQTCSASSNISIDKKVLNPKTNLLVDNLGINDPKYQPNFIVNFQIKITNTGSNTLSKVNIKDVFPQYISFGAGAGNFDANTKTLSLSISNLNSNETRTLNVIGRILAKDHLPQGVVCVVNQATAIMDNSQTSQDNTQFCIENATNLTTPGRFPIFPTNNVKQTPATGPESLALFSLIPTGILGWILRKKFKQQSPL